MDSTPYSLDQPLPEGALRPARKARHLYGHYPVFSWPWLRGRTQVFLSAIALYTCFNGISSAYQTGSTSSGLQVALTQFLCFGLMTMAGPGLATWIRYRRWSARREAVWVVIATLCGIAISAVVDLVGSLQVTRLMGEDNATTVGSPPSALLVMNLLVLLLIYGAFGGGLALRAYFTERRRWAAHQQQEALQHARLLASQADLRLGVLQAQVEPHFLFNTLASVRASLREDPHQAEATLDALVGFLRSTIPQLRAEGAVLVSTLRQQVAICRHYLEVMALRTGGRLRYAIDLPDDLAGHSFPPSLLITLVENAVKHGIEPRPGPGSIHLSAASHQGRLQVSVSDDGAGLQPGLGSGTGLANVRAHLAQRYGGHGRFQLTSRPGGGVVAMLDLPMETA